jgi:hypothetical protein
MRADGLQLGSNGASIEVVSANVATNDGRLN